MSKIFPLKLSRQTKELKELIAAHPDYPIVVLAGEEANSGDYSWVYCMDVGFSVGEVLDCVCPYNDEEICADRDEFEEKMEELVYDEMRCDSGKEPTEEEFQQRFKEELERYEPYWRKVIEIWATN